MQKTALVTGASGGIGYEICKLLARDKYDLVLVSRNQGKLKKNAAEMAANFGVNASIIVQDLAQATASQQIFHYIKKHSISVDVLVNNAGFGSYGVFEESNSIKNLDMMLTNIVALTQLTHLLIPEIKANGGKILNLASLAAFQPVPNFAVYAATKAYVLSFSEALAEELRGTGVTVTALCPGVTKSGFQKEANMLHTNAAQGKMLSAVSVAAAGYRGMLKGKPVVVPGGKEKIMAAAVKLAPRGMVVRASRAMMK